MLLFLHVYKKAFYTIVNMDRGAFRLESEITYFFIQSVKRCEVVLQLNMYLPRSGGDALPAGPLELRRTCTAFWDSPFSYGREGAPKIRGGGRK